MELFRPDTRIDFVGLRKYALTFSGLMIFVSVVSLTLHRGPNLGVDFAGGTLIQLTLPPGGGISHLRKNLEEMGLVGAQIQRLGESQGREYIIRIPMVETGNEELSTRIRKNFENQFGLGAIDIRRIEIVGPKAGRELTDKALFALFFAILFMAVYISGRFERKWMASAAMAASIGIPSYILKDVVGLAYLIVLAVIITIGLCVLFQFRFALGAIVALIHDVVITVGAVLSDRQRVHVDDCRSPADDYRLLPE